MNDNEPPRAIPRLPEPLISEGDIRRHIEYINQLCTEARAALTEAERAYDKAKDVYRHLSDEVRVWKNLHESLESYGILRHPDYGGYKSGEATE